MFLVPQTLLRLLAGAQTFGIAPKVVILGFVAVCAFDVVDDDDDTDDDISDVVIVAVGLNLLLVLVVLL